MIRHILTLFTSVMVVASCFNTQQGNGQSVQGNQPAAGSSQDAEQNDGRISGLVNLSSEPGDTGREAGNQTGRKSARQTTSQTGRKSSQTTDLLELPAISSSDEIITHEGYVISYNSDMLIPDWVAYELTAEELEGDEERGDRMFSKDPLYKKKQAMREDYSESGWTKGHMAPAKDFSWDSDAMDGTFFLTNVCPQNEVLNANDWNYLEKQVRRWAREYGKVWVVTGPIIYNNRYGRIGDRGVVVPDAFFKAVLAQKNGKYISIAFTMENDSSRYYLDKCAINVNDLEEITGLDFFPSLDDKYEDSVESQLKFSDWGIRKY